MTNNNPFQQELNNQGYTEAVKYYILAALYKVRVSITRYPELCLACQHDEWNLAYR
jgi:hypothetical protein